MFQLDVIRCNAFLPHSTYILRYLLVVSSNILGTFESFSQTSQEVTELYI